MSAHLAQITAKLGSLFTSPPQPVSPPPSSSSLPPLSRVAIIGGGGPAGLAAIAQLIAKGVPPQSIVAYEARSTLGGVWNYESSPAPCLVSFRPDGLAVAQTPAEQVDPRGTRTAREGGVYQDLRTNLPKNVMAFRGHEFPEDVPLFPTHEQVRDYLDEFARKERLEEYVRLGTTVESVYHTEGDSVEDGRRWTVETSAVGEDGSAVLAKESFSHIIITNGHYSSPLIPYIPGLWDWSREIVHSRWWRRPSLYATQNILVVGGKASGGDIVRELAMHDLAQETQPNRCIIQSLRGKLPTEPREEPWQKRVEVVAEIERVDADTIYLKDGSKLEGVDTILFATGYLYHYPFFDETKAPWKDQPVTRSVEGARAGQERPPGEKVREGLPRAGGQRMCNLDQSDIFYVPDKTMSFIALHYQTNPLPLSEVLARLIVHSYIHQTIPDLPPLLRASDDPHDIYVGAPNEFINQDNFLLAIGEGGDDGGGKPGGWKRTDEKRIRDRIDAPRLRKEHLGY